MIVVMRVLSWMQTELGMSRRKAFAAIQEGRVTCDQQVIENSKFALQPGMQVTVLDQGNSQTHTFAGEETVSDSQLVLFHKPVGCVVSMSDRHNQTIYDVLPARFASYYPIGRLDKNSEGLLLLVEDRALVNELMHPGGGHDKVYHVTLDADRDHKNTQAACDGLWLDENGRLAVPYSPGADYLSCAAIRSLRSDQRTVSITLQEGKKRHIRRLLRGLGYHVVRLVRQQYGQYSLGALASGQWKELTVSRS